MAEVTIQIQVTLFYKRLLDLGLKPNQIAGILKAMDGICPHCWDAEIANGDKCYCQYSGCEGE